MALDVHRDRIHRDVRRRHLDVNAERRRAAAQSLWSDAELVDRLVSAFSPAETIETIFKYEPGGWQLSDRASCSQCEFFDIHESKGADPSTTPHAPDYAAGERALACLELRK
jgi:hypothetical protein